MANANAHRQQASHSTQHSNIESSQRCHQPYESSSLTYTLTRLLLTNTASQVLTNHDDHGDCFSATTIITTTTVSSGIHHTSGMICTTPLRVATRSALRSKGTEMKWFIAVRGKVQQHNIVLHFHHHDQYLFRPPSESLTIGCGPCGHSLHLHCPHCPYYSTMTD